MALTSALIGSAFGFTSFILALTVYQTGLLLGFAVYSGTGICVTLACIALGMASKSATVTTLSPVQSHARG